MFVDVFQLNASFSRFLLWALECLAEVFRVMDEESFVDIVLLGVVDTDLDDHEALGGDTAKVDQQNLKVKFSESVTHPKVGGDMHGLIDSEFAMVRWSCKRMD
jgi:hypothetical protein